jgi:hypothetical protein
MVMLMKMINKRDDDGIYGIYTVMHTSTSLQAVTILNIRYNQQGPNNHLNLTMHCLY